MVSTLTYFAYNTDRVINILSIIRNPLEFINSLCFPKFKRKAHVPLVALYFELNISTDSSDYKGWCYKGYNSVELPCSIINYWEDSDWEEYTKTTNISKHPSTSNTNDKLIVYISYNPSLENSILYHYFTYNGGFISPDMIKLS